MIVEKFSLFYLSKMHIKEKCRKMVWGLFLDTHPFVKHSSNLKILDIFVSEEMIGIE